MTQERWRAQKFEPGDPRILRALRLKEGGNVHWTSPIAANNGRPRQRMVSAAMWVLSAGLRSIFVTKRHVSDRMVALIAVNAHLGRPVAIKTLKGIRHCHRTRVHAAALVERPNPSR
jgi:hypothetical protein